MESKSIVNNGPTGFYQLIIESMQDYAVFTTDEKGIINSWSKGASNVLGYEPDEIVGRDSEILFTKEDIKRSVPQLEIKEAIRKGSALDERYHVRKDGTKFWVSGKMFPLFNEKGKHIGFTKVMRNFDQQKLNTERILEAEKYAESIVESAREPIIVLNSDLTINSANDAFYKMFKLNKKKCRQKLVYEVGKGVFNFPELEEFLQSVQKAEEAIIDYEIEREWPLLGKKFFRVNARKLVHPSTRSDLILFSIEDITQQRTLEQQKDDFISIASHEIRTPVTVIKAYAQILKGYAEKVKDEMIAKSASKIDEKGEKLMSLVGYLLDVSQLATGELSIKKSHFNICDLIKESIDELVLIDPHKFIVKGKITEQVFADMFRISQVLNNLLNNACKYSPPDRPINIQIKKNRKGDMVNVSVKDTGIGIPLEEQKNIFKRFWRASTARKKGISGIGLGLHISSEIIKQHQGKMWLKSDKDMGSKFYLSLPLA